MGKLEPFEGKQTNWIGLWWHPEINAFLSPTLDLADLRKFKGQFKIQIRKNKYYNNGENGRPNYCFTIREAHSDAFENILVDEDEKAEQYKFTYEELQNLINKIAYHIGGDKYYGEFIVSDFLE